MTSIEWCDYSFNPWIGCTKVAAGCTNCYAEKNVAVTMGVGRGSWGPSGTRYVTKGANWKKPLAWARKARTQQAFIDAAVRGPNAPVPQHRPRVFCASLADVFEDRPDLVGPRLRLLALIEQTPELDWLLLTKRPENVRRLLREGYGAAWNEIRDPQLPVNVWLGTSIANQEDADRNIPELLKVPAAVHFVSYEPAVGPVDIRDAMKPICVKAQCKWHGANPRPEGRGRGVPHIDWLIVGGESGPKARPCDVAWIRSAVEQCKAAQVPVFVKQIGTMAVGACGDPGLRFLLKSKKGGDPSEWPEDLRVREFPEVRA